MAPRGKLIAFEGIDGSGKRTQMEMLSRALHQRGITHTRISFPRYQGFFGRMVARYLNGEFGTLAQVDAHFSALLYAGDRLENRRRLEENLARGKIVLADRYIGSNLAHQGARTHRGQLASFLAWLERVEYRVYGLPREDLVIYLRVPARHAQRMVAQKNTRGYTRRRHDLQEANLAHLKAAASIYERLAKGSHWIPVECMARGKSGLLAPEAIHRAIMKAVERHVLRGLQRRKKD